MKILVTGTAGFIGYHLAKKLLERGDTVVGLDNINDYYDVNLKYVRLGELGITRHSQLDEVSTYADVSGLIGDFGYKHDTRLARGIGELLR